MHGKAFRSLLQNRDAEKTVRDGSPGPNHLMLETRNL
jgi:hypothetical protein